MLNVMRMDDLDRAIELANQSAYGNGAAIFTNSGKAAREFKHRVKAGMVGINVGVPATMAMFPFTGWDDSFYGDLHIQGKEGVQFYTQQKVVTHPLVRRRRRRCLEENRSTGRERFSVQRRQFSHDACGGASRDRTRPRSAMACRTSEFFFALDKPSTYRGTAFCESPELSTRSIDADYLMRSPSNIDDATAIRFMHAHSRLKSSNLSLLIKNGEIVTPTSATSRTFSAKTKRSRGSIANIDAA